VIGLPLLLFLVAPPIALLTHGGSGLGRTILQPDSLAAIGVSLRTTSVSLVLLLALGTPLAAFVIRVRGALGKLIETVLDLPLVLPPAAAGLGLLLAFGRKGLIPTGLPFTAGAVIAAQLFVSAPLYVRAAMAAFRAVPDDVIATAKTEGAGPLARFTKIVVPLSAPTMVSGAAMAWARALGEFGATILFAGSLTGRTKTLPLAIYLGFETDLDEAVGLSVLLLGIAVVVLVGARLLLGRVGHDEPASLP
jgi:molybdate transport system permease protein